MTFGTYPPADVTWLVQDANALDPAHHMGIPLEPAPDPERVALFRDCLDAQAGIVAEAVGRLGQRIVADVGTDVTLVSIIRGGVPLGVLVRRWLASVYGIDVPHFAISLIPGYGADRAALQHVAQLRDPQKTVFLDGWTGRGTVHRELQAALGALQQSTGIQFRDSFACLVDPAGTATYCGSDRDLAVPTALVESTASGLVSRALQVVQERGSSQAGGFHVSRFYEENLADDLSIEYVDAVVGEFERAVADNSADTRVRVEGSVHDLDETVLPGIGESTRQILRGGCERLVVSDREDPQVRWLLELAKGNGVPVSEDPALFWAAAVRKVARS